MLRTNQTFLDLVTTLYENQENHSEIVKKRFESGQKLFSQNEPATKVMFILDGITKCYFTEENDKEFIVEFLGKGEVIGEVECFGNSTCLCNIEAMSDVTTFWLSLTNFKKLVQNNLTFNHLLLKSFADRIINTSKRASFQQSYTIQYSLANLIKLQEKQNIKLSKEEMAAYLGVTVRSLNRVLKKASD